VRSTAVAGDRLTTTDIVPVAEPLCGAGSTLAGPSQVVGGGEHLAPDGLEVDAFGEQPGGDPFDDAPLPDGGGIKARPGCEPSGSRMGVAVEQLNGVFAHDDPEVILGLG